MQVPIWQHIWCRLRKITPYTHTRIVGAQVKRWKKDGWHQKGKADKKVRFLLRVDDFPRWDLSIEEFQNFDAILAELDIEYCLGVTPRIADDPLDPSAKCDAELSDQASALLKDISGRVDIALHGLTHRVQSSQIRSEFDGLRPEIVEKYIVEGLTLLNKLDAKPVGFIPPFNSISISALPVLARYFKFLFGGPESIATLGFRTSPSVLAGMIYFPSYPPVYGTAKEMLTFVKKWKQKKLPLIIPLTIHWAWENRDNYITFKKLCKELVGYTVSLTQLNSLSADLKDYFLEKD